MEDKGISEESLRSKVDAKVLSLEAEIKERDARIKKLTNRMGQMERFESDIFKSIVGLPKIRSLQPYDPKAIGKKKDHDAILNLADPHAEEFVSAEEMEGYAEYTWEIFKNRMWDTGEELVKRVHEKRSQYQVSRLIVSLLGDMLTGVIHDELDRTNTWTLPNAVVATAYILAQLLIKVSAEFDEVLAEACVGNHGREDKKPTSKQKVDRNWDYGVYKIAQLLTINNTKIKWNIPKSEAHIFKAQGSSVLMKHGDNIRHTGILPYYGISRDLAEEHEKRRDKDFDYCLMGHWHHFAVVKGHCIICPSMIGPSQYSFNRLNTTYPAEQFLIFSTSDFGFTDFRKISLSNAQGNKFVDAI